MTEAETLTPRREAAHAETVTFRYRGKDCELPLVEGSEGERAVDITSQMSALAPAMNPSCDT